MKKSLLDVAFDRVESVTAWMFERDLFKNWFNIISWTGLTSALYILFIRTEIKLFVIISSISAVLVFFYGWHTVMLIVSETKHPEKTGLKKFVTVLITLIAIGGLFKYLTEAFSVVLLTGT